MEDLASKTLVFGQNTGEVDPEEAAVFDDQLPVVDDVADLAASACLDRVRVVIAERHQLGSAKVDEDDVS